MTGRDEQPAHMKEEGFSLRDAGLTLAEAFGAVGLTAALVNNVGPLGVLAFPPLMWIFWKRLREPEPVREQVPWNPAPFETEWLEDAHSSRARGTHISTLAVRYGVDPVWLEAELDGLGQMTVDDRARVDAGRQGAEGVSPLARQA